MFCLKHFSLKCIIKNFFIWATIPLNKGTRIALHVRDVGELGICIMGGSVLCFCIWNYGQWTLVLCWPFCSFSRFVFATWGLWWWWFPDTAVDLLSAIVDWTCLIALHVVVSDVYHRIFINIEINLLLFAHSTSLIDGSNSMISWRVTIESTRFFFVLNCLYVTFQNTAYTLVLYDNVFTCYIYTLYVRLLNAMIILIRF